jgi:hypothetical protein
LSLRLVLAVALAYSFGALSVTADEIFWMKQDQGTDSLYYFPILGPWKVWAAWDLVFAGMGVCFTLFCAVLSIRQMPKAPNLHLPTLHSPDRTPQSLPPLQVIDTRDNAPIAVDRPSEPSLKISNPGLKPVGDTGFYERTV